MTWNNVKLPFGLINGRLKHIDDVTNGRSCGCRCPKCERPLEARNAGTIRAHYFAHYDSDECAGATETAIHRMAKQLIADAKTIKTPLFERIPQCRDAEGNTHYGRLVRIEPKLVNAQSSFLEDHRQGYTPDVTLMVKDRQLLVEIKVTHKVDFDKQLKVENNDEAMIEIDLSDVEPAILLELSKFEYHVTHEAPRHWIHNPQGTDRYEQAVAELRQQVDQLNIGLEKKIKARIEKEKRDRKQQLEYEARRTQERAKHIEKLKELELYQSLEWQRQRELLQKYSVTKSADVLKIKEAEQIYGLHPLIDIGVKNAWIFNVHRSIWQAHILNTMVFGRKAGQEFSVKWVEQAVVSKFGLMDVVRDLSNLKQNYKRIGRERNQWYKDRGCWFFSDQENRKIPSPFGTVIEYLKHLERLGIIQSVRDNLFSVHIANFDDYIYSIQEARKRQQAKLDKEAAQLAVEIRARKEERSRILKQKEERQKEIMASELRIFKCFDGQARQCKICYLFSHITDGAACPFCGHEALEEIVVSSYHIEKAVFRYNCSTCPSLSIERFPEISNEDLLLDWMHKEPDVSSSVDKMDQ